MRKISDLILVALLLVWIASPACACINDRDTRREERQFKALYPNTPPESPAIQGETGNPQLVAWGGSGLGIAMLGLAGYVGLVRRGV